jgi:hypothetical protein
LIREQLGKKNVAADTRFALATARLQEATQYQNSQTIPRIGAGTLKSGVTSAVRARAEFDLEKFNSLFDASR